MNRANQFSSNFEILILERVSELNRENKNISFVLYNYLENIVTLSNTI
jgi:hypothetical protein